MSTFKKFVDQFTLTEEEIELLWKHLLMFRLINWRDGLTKALAEGGK